MVLSERAQALKNMDNAIRFINDEGNGIFDTWIAICIPDDTREDEWEEWAKDDELYDRCCEVFARNVARLIVEGEWDSQGFCAEFYNAHKDKKLEW